MNKEFTVKCFMEERWIPAFMSMLKTMEDYGNLGHSEIVGIYSDGDGDFHPKFKSDVEYEEYCNDPDYCVTKPDWCESRKIVVYDADYHL